MNEHYVLIENQSLQTAMQIFLNSGQDVLPVTTEANRDIVGTLSAKQVLSCIHQRGLDGNTRVKDIMSKSPRDIQVFSPEDREGLVNHFMQDEEYAWIQDDEVIRVLSKSGFLEYILSEPGLVELDKVIENSFDGICITDGQGIVRRINKAYERITGLKVDDILDQSIFTLVEKGYYSESTTIKILKSKTPVTMVQKINTGRSVITTGVPIFDSRGNIKWIVHNVRDISELIFLKYQFTPYQYQKHHEPDSSTMTNFVSSSREMEEILENANRISSTNATVLLLGESGVGKEILAQHIHVNSAYSKGKLVTINCGAIPSYLLESELFGYAPGAFTGALKTGKKGLIQEAHNGTLFLDEIGELPLDMQVKLLRFLQTREYIPVGDTTVRKVNTRIIAATHRNLSEMVKQGAFREDLYYRLNVVPILIPPLRQRRSDIYPLTMNYLEHFNTYYETSKTLAPEVIDRFMEYNWPGNIRELVNIMERLVLTTKEETITLLDLPDHFNVIRKSKIEIQEVIPLKEAVLEVEKELIVRALKEYQSTRKAAQALGIGQATLLRKIKSTSQGFDFH